MVANQELVRFWNPRDTGETTQPSSGVPLIGIALVIGAVVAFNMFEKKRRA